MFVEIGLQGEGFVTAFAIEVFESRMGLHVSAKVGAVCKGFSTVGTTIGLVPRVAAHVTLQQPGPRESLSTDITLVVEVMSEDVHAEGGHAHIHLIADRALLGVP